MSAVARPDDESATVGAYEAKTHLPRLLERVQAGETITITKHGHPIARLVPTAADPARTAAEIVAEFRRNRPTLGLPSGVTIRDLIDEGHRYR